MISKKRRQAANIIGTIAAVLMVISFIPQVIHSYTSNDTGVSVAMYCIFSTGVLMWLIYGILIEEIVIIVSNIIMMILVVLVLISTVRKGRLELRCEKSTQT
jgi:MtN3 and saliva related transmembrane protein